MPAVLRTTVSGLEELQSAVVRFRTLFDPAALIARTMELAALAGAMIKEHVVAELVAEIYSSPAPEVLFSGSGLMDQGGFDTPDRTGALSDAHTLIDEGLLQTICVDMDYPVEDVHSGRESVGDYAMSVHDGYLQWIPTRGGAVPSETFHPGRPWFERGAFESQEIAVQFIMQAFSSQMEIAWEASFA